MIKQALVDIPSSGWTDLSAYISPTPVPFSSYTIFVRNTSAGDIKIGDSSGSTANAYPVKAGESFSASISAGDHLSAISASGTVTINILIITS